jgi:hypothetical protein
MPSSSPVVASMTHRSMNSAATVGVVAKSVTRTISTSSGGSVAARRENAPSLAATISTVSGRASSGDMAGDGMAG